MLNELQLMGQELERDIIALQENSVMKSGQLKEVRTKMYKEIAENNIIRNKLDKIMNELDLTKTELKHSIKVNETLLEEIRKCWRQISKLQSENDFYKKESELIKDAIEKNDTYSENIRKIEIISLRSQVKDLKEKLQECITYKEFQEKLQQKNKTLIDEISSQAEFLAKEQSRLENSLKKGISLSTKLSEECNLQSHFVKEANISRVILEKEMLRLIGVLKEERFMKRSLLKSLAEKEQKGNYLDHWKSSQEEVTKKIRILVEENMKLVNEVNDLKIQLNEQMEKNLLLKNGLLKGEHV